MVERDNPEDQPVDQAPESDAASEQKRKVPSRKAVIWTGFGGFLMFLLAVSIFFWLSFTTVEVQGNSMEPTLDQGQRLLVSKAYWLVGPIKENDIVVIKKPDEVIIKRVYKMAGETVDLAQVPETWDITRGKYVVPEGTIYVLGDNRDVSEDSRQDGPFPIKDVLGKVVVIQSAIGSSEEPGS